jgi:hypothetical protein
MAKKKGRLGVSSRGAKGSSSKNSKPRHGSPPLDSSEISATQAITVTVFRDEYATSSMVEDLTLPELRDLILSTDAATKGDLPWLKLASFGTKRDKSNCLRWDGNVTGINGIELDYDAKKKAFDDAVGKLKELNVYCLIYTSPSYTLALPKWRLLFPLSKPALPEMRRAYVARVNGFFGNIFAPESFTLSQSYYYGMARDNPAPDHKAVVIDGDFIDLREDLAKYQAIGEQEQKTNKQQGGRGFEYYLKTMGDPSPPLAGFNGPLISASSSYAVHHGADFDREELKTKLRDAINRAPKGKDRKTADIERYLSDKYLDALIESAVEKFGHGVTAEDFVSYSPQHFYIYKPIREQWITAGVNACCRPMPDLVKNGKQRYIKANEWIDRYHSVQQMTWAPGEPMEIRDKLIKEGSGWIAKRGVTCFNLYLPPDIVHGDASNVAPWLDHVRRVYPDDAEHIIKFCAQRVQPHRSRSTMRWF